MKKVIAIIMLLSMLLGCACSASAEDEYESLCNLAANYGFKLGSCLSYNQMRDKCPHRC